MILPRTINDGEAAVLKSPKGTRRIVHGPKIVFAPFERLEMLQRRIARDGQYLGVKFTDGTTEHRPGPCESWFDPYHHTSVDVEEAINLDAHQAVVIYREDGDGVTHRVLNGPAVYIPQPNEWLHQFNWHGDDGNGRKRPGRLQFEKLRIIPDQMYFDVSAVRTADEALIKVCLMVFFELTDIERMLAQTHDPVADFINALSADVIRFAGGCDFESFKTKAAELNRLETYRELTRGAEKIGYHVNKVVYRGYLAPDNLQKMHDNAIETRTSLVLEAETEERRQEIADFQQAHDHERAARDREERQRALDHKIQQDRLTREDKLSARRDEEELALAHLVKRQENEEKHRKNLLELKTAEWDHLKEAGADLTAILVAQERNPDKIIRLEQDATQGDVHLHEAL